MNVMQVLIIDINRAFRMTVAECIISLGHAVAQVESGEDALAYIQQNTVDFVIMDWEMPGMGAPETTQAIRQAQVDDWFPIIYLTDNPSEALFALAVKAGGNALVSKPIDAFNLQTHITALAPTFNLRKKLQASQQGLLKLNDTLKYLSMFDPHTGLANRRNFDDTTRREFKLAQREKIPLSLMMCDIDYFRLFNDRLGHVAGDDCLNAVASLIAAITHRPTDLACRYGGEEFTVILPKTDLKGAQELAEKIRQTVQKSKILHQDSPISAYITLSVGVASFNGQFDYANDLTRAAETALKTAKENGRNRVEMVS